MDAHHPQTAAAALAQMETAQQQNRTLYRFPFTPERTLTIQRTSNVHTKRTVLPPNYVGALPKTTTHY